MTPSTRRRIAFAAWFVLACSGAVSIGAYHYPAWADLTLAGVWLAAAVASVWASPSQRTVSLIVVLASSVAMRRLFLQMLWAIATARGQI